MSIDCPYCRKSFSSQKMINEWNSALKKKCDKHTSKLAYVKTKSFQPSKKQRREKSHMCGGPAGFSNESIFTVIL